MDENKRPQTLIECTLKVSLQGKTSENLTAAEAHVRHTELALEVMPKYGDALSFLLRDIVKLEAADYQVMLAMANGEVVSLFHLGYKYADFVRVLIAQRNELMLADLLMYENVLRAGITARCTVYDSQNNSNNLGLCELRICDTALLILAESEEPMRIPMSFLERVEEQDYLVKLFTESGQRLELSRMGQDFEPFTQLLSKQINALSLKCQDLLRELAPAASPDVIRRAARLMREGRAGRRCDLEAIAGDLWGRLERRLDSAGIQSEYQFLAARARTAQLAIGFKRELLANGEYIWFLIPIAGKNQPGNLIAMEASAGPGGGRATYFFRIAPRAEYPRLEDEQIAALTDQLIVHINRCMLTINFRREPIYLSTEKLSEPRYHKYRLAVDKIPELRELRRRYIGRVFHRNQEQWQADVLDLLEFNCTATDDSLRWTKGDLAESQAE